MQTQRKPLNEQTRFHKPLRLVVPTAVRVSTLQLKRLWHVAHRLSYQGLRRLLSCPLDPVAYLK